MGVSLKPGVEMEYVALAGYEILRALRLVARRMDINLTITSGTDGNHSGPNDPHKTGEAYDVRSQGFNKEYKQTILAAVMAELGANFYGFLEDEGKVNEHFHFQRRRGTTYTIKDFLAE